MGQYIRHAIVSINEVISKIKTFQGTKQDKVELSTGHHIGVVSLRMRTFGREGCNIHCQGCGLKAQYFAVESFAGSIHPSVHTNLYGMNGEKEVLFTQDHIVPKSRGGANSLDNSQVLCQCCNTRKGSRSDKEFKEEMQIVC